MNTDRKERSDSKLGSLTPEQKSELTRKLMSAVSHEDCKSWLRDSCGVVVKSGDTLTNFYQRYCKPIVDEQRKFAAVRAEAYGDSVEATPVDWVSKILERIKQLAFELMLDPSPDAAKVKELVDALVKLDKQSLDREKFKEALRKAKAAEKVTADDSLTEEEKAAELKRIFRMG